MTSTETSSSSKSRTIVTTSGTSANFEDIHDENLLREMWQDMDDMDAKRQIRSRMYKLREERLKEFYGREGQGILDNILKPASEEAHSVSSMEGTRERTVTTTASRTIDGEEVTESRTVHAKQTISKGSEADGGNVINTIVTTTTRTTGGEGEDEGISNSTVTKSRIINKERTGQMQEIRSQQQHSSSKRNVSTSEGTKPLSKRGSMDSDISVTRGQNNGSSSNSTMMKGKGMTNGVVSKQKQTTTKAVTSSSSNSGGGEGSVSTTTNSQVSTAVVSTSVGSERNEDVCSELEEYGNKSVAALRKNFQQADFSTSSMMTMSSSSMQVMSSSTTSTSTREVRGSSSPGTTRVISSSSRIVTSSESGRGGMPMQTNVHIRLNENQLGGSLTGTVGEKLEVGRVLIKEIGGGNIITGSETQQQHATSTGETIQNSAGSRSQVRSSSPITSSSLIVEKTRGIRSRQNSKDANLINGASTEESSSRKTTVRTSSSSSISGRNTKTTSTPSSSGRTNSKTTDRLSSTSTTRSKKTTSSMTSKSSNISNTSSTTESSSNAKTSPTSHSPSSRTKPAGKIMTEATSSEIAVEKVCRRGNKLSRESSPKSRTTSRRQVSDDNLKQQQKTTSTSSPTKAPVRTTSKTRIVEKNQQQQQQPKQAMKTGPTSSTTTTTTTKGEPDKTSKSTEEKIMRELDILDTYLSQRSASIDESAVVPPGKASPSPPPAPTSKINGTYGGDEKKVRKSEKNFSLGEKASNFSTTSIVRTSTAVTATNNAEVDVMESGVEPPFTRTTYKYDCPDDKNRHPHRHSPDRSTNKPTPKKITADDKGKQPKDDKVGAKRDKTELEDQIITNATTANTGKPTDKGKPSKPRSESTGERRPTSKSPEKKRKPVPSPKTDESPKREVRESPISRSRAAHVTTTQTSINQDGSSRGSPGRRTTTQTTTNNNQKPIPPTSGTGSPKKKDLLEGNESNTATITQSSSTSRQESKLSSRAGMTEAEKYEADILSRPSVFAARRATAAQQKSTVTASQKHSEVNNQRIRKGSESSPERELPSPNIRGRVTSQQDRNKCIREQVQQPRQVDDGNEPLEDEDNPLNPPKRFGSSGNYLESPGAVLKAKSLFENKAQEAAKDRSSTELGSKVTTSPKLTVSRKAALFEARSRGERISISSGSSNSLNEIDEDSPDRGNLLPEHKYQTCKVPEVNERAVSMERRVSEVVTVVQRDSKFVKAEESREVTVNTHEFEDHANNTKFIMNKKNFLKEEAVPEERKVTNRSTSNSGGKAEVKVNRVSTDNQQSSVLNSKRVSDSQRTIVTRKSTETPRESPERGQVTQPRETVGKVGRQKSIEKSLKSSTKDESSSERQVTIKKKDSKNKMEVKSDNKSLDSSVESKLKRKNSRESPSTKVSSKETTQKKTSHDVEQRNIENRERSSGMHQVRKNEIISTNQTPNNLPELKSTNVVRETMRQAKSAVVSQETVVVTSQFSSSTMTTGSSSTPEIVSKPNANTTITELITKSPKLCKRASKSPERSDASPGMHSAETATVNKVIIERRRSSNLEKKVEALMAGVNKTCQTSTPINTNRMTTAELNAVDEMENIEELEVLLERAVDYDERSKIRARIRLLKRKATLVKRVSDVGSPERQPSSPEEEQQKPRTTEEEVVVERRTYKENRVSSRKSSNELETEKKPYSRKSSDEILKKSPVKMITDKEPQPHKPFRRESPPSKVDRQSPPPSKVDRQSPPRSKVDRQSPPSSRVPPEVDERRIGERNINERIARKTPEKSPTPQRTIGSRSNSAKLFTKIAEGESEISITENDSQVERKSDEDKRKLSTETTELLSTRSYARDNETTEGLQTKTSTKSSTVTTTTTTTAFTGSESVVIQDSDLYSSRRSSRNLEDDKVEIDKLKRSISRTDSSQRVRLASEDRNNGVTVTQPKSRSASPQSKFSSRSPSPQRSEIPISSRMKRERSLSPPKVIPKEPTAATIVEEVKINDIPSSSSITKREQQQKEEEIICESSPAVPLTNTPSRRVSSRKPSSELNTEESPEKRTPKSSISPERKVNTNKASITATDEMSEAEAKYAADILSRPSVFAARRAVAATKETTSTVTQKSEDRPVEPKRKSASREPSPEKETVSNPPSNRSPPQRTTFTNESSRESPSRKGPVTRGDSSRNIKVTSDSSITEEDNRTKEKVNKAPIEDSTVSKQSRNNSYSRRNSSKELTKRSSKTEMSTSSQTRDEKELSSSSVAIKRAETTSSTSTTQANKLIDTTATQSINHVASETKPSEKEPKISSAAPSPSPLKTSADTKEKKSIETKAASPAKTPVYSRPTTTPSVTSTRRTTIAAPSANISTHKGKVTERTHSTDMVTSSYGVGPVDDDGKPLFGLRALRKIKQAQESHEATVSDIPATEEEETTTTTTTTTTVTSKKEDTSARKGTTSSFHTFPEDSGYGVTSNLQNLRSNDMYGLRALRKQATENTTSEDEQPLTTQRPKEKSPSPVEKDIFSSSVSRTMRSGSKSSTFSSQNISSSRGRVSDSEESTFSKVNQMDEDKDDDNEDDGLDEGEEEIETTITTTEIVTTTESGGNGMSSGGLMEGRRVGSPKSILKKTSSFSSAASKNSESGGTWEDEQSSEVLIPESFEEDDLPNSQRNLDETSTTTTIEEKQKFSSKTMSHDDESWRRGRSNSPSPKVASSSTASSIATFSRGKVGRSSVREMSRRYEDTGDNAHISKSSSSTSISSEMRSSVDRESSPSIPLQSRGSRAESPSRIPLSIKSSSILLQETSGKEHSQKNNNIVSISSRNLEDNNMTGSSYTETQSFETGGPIVNEDGSGQGEIRIQGRRQKKSEQRHFENSDGSISVTSNVVRTQVVTSSSTTTSSRSFLNDQSPIQNLEDVIDRMRGEDPELSKTFISSESSSTGDNSFLQANHGRNLLNKFIGAQVIMQAVEPMLISQKVSMSVSSSLEQSGANLEAGMDSPTIREMIENSQGEVEQSSIQQTTQSRGGGGSVEITEISSSSHTPILIQQSSVISESGGGSSDVTGELMPFILDQLQSSLSSLSTSPAIIGGGASASSSDGHSATFSTSPSLSCHNLMGNQHHLHHLHRHQPLSNHHHNANSHNSCVSSNNRIAADKGSNNNFRDRLFTPSSPSSTGVSISSPSSSLLSAQTTSNNISSNNPVRGQLLTFSPFSSTTELCNESGVVTSQSDGGRGVPIEYESSSVQSHSEQQLPREEERSSTATTTGSSSSSSEECLFDSGTESGEDLSANINSILTTAEGAGFDEDTLQQQQPPTTEETSPLPTSSSSPLSTLGKVADVQLASQGDDAASEFSYFIEGLKNSLKRNTKKESVLRFNNYGGGGDDSQPQKLNLDSVPISPQQQQQYHYHRLGPGKSVSSDWVISGSVSPKLDSQRKFSIPEPLNPPPTESSVGRIKGSVEERIRQNSLHKTDRHFMTLIPNERSTLKEHFLNNSNHPSSINITKSSEVVNSTVGESSSDDSGLIQQVDKVLTLLRASLVKDPNALTQISGNPNKSINSESLGLSEIEPSKGKELIALIDRLKSSLSVEEKRQDDDSLTSPSILNYSDTSAEDPADKSFDGDKIELEKVNLSSNMIGCVQAQLPPDIAKSNSSHLWSGGLQNGNNSDLINESFFSPTAVTPPLMETATISKVNLTHDMGSILDANSNTISSYDTSAVGNGFIGGGEADSRKVDQSEEIPWKIRLARRRSQPRSHTVGVTQEELAEARRLFEESTGFQFYGRDPKEKVEQEQQQHSIYSNVQDLSSLGNSENVRGKFNGQDGLPNNNNLNSNIGSMNNYQQSEAVVVGTAPHNTHHNPRVFTSLEGNDEQPLLSPTSALPFPHGSSSLNEVEVRSQNNNSGSILSRENTGEIMPSGGGCVSTTTATSSSIPNWQTDVEKRLTSIPRPFVPFVKHATKFYEGYQPPPERRMTYASIDDSCQIVGGVIGNLKIKPFRTYSLDNNKTSCDDPSKSFFTPQETVQIAIHKAAIKKQMSEEEDRRKRRNSLSSYQFLESGIKPDRNFALGMPKPYSPPHAAKQQPPQQQNTPSEQNQSSFEVSPLTSQPSNGYSSFYQSADSGYTEESGPESSHHKEDQSTSTSIVPFGSSIGQVSLANSSDPMVTAANTITYTTTPTGGFVHHQQQQQQQSPTKRIENVQISLKELSSSEFPQLQIAITLNTKNNSSSSSENISGNNGTITVSALPSENNAQDSLGRIPNVAATTTTSGNTVTTNLKLGGNGISSGNNNNMVNVRKLQTDVCLSGSSGNLPFYFSNDEGQQTSASASRAIRYKSKNERKKRLKRANTIDIPHPPGLLLLSNNNEDDDDSEMEDEEDSDTNNYRSSMKTNGMGGNSINPGKYHHPQQPFLPKTDGDRKFLAFLEKNNGLGGGGSGGGGGLGGRPTRPSYLGVNDHPWNSRFSNLKTSFESSSQGSSPSASPIPSPLRQPRSVSEMALSHGKQSNSSGGESCSKPVWASSEKSQLPPQVRNKLHVFENKSFENQPSSVDYPLWRSPPPGVQQHVSGSGNNPYGSSSNSHHHRSVLFPGMKQTMSTNALHQSGQPSRIYNRPVYSSHDNVAAVSQKKLLFQGNSFDSKLNEQQHHQPHQMNRHHHSTNVRKPTPVKSHQSFPNLPSEQTINSQQISKSGNKPSNVGVHMVHATATAMEAMKKSAFVPASVAPANSIQNNQADAITTKMGLQTQQTSHEEKINLPWTKGDPHDNSSRVQSSKTLFEPSAGTSFSQSNSAAPLTYTPPEQQQNYNQSNKAPQTNFPSVPQQQQQNNHVSPTATAFNNSEVSPTANSRVAKSGFNNMGDAAEDFVPVVRPSLKSFGGTQSYDEAFKRNFDQKMAIGSHFTEPVSKENMPPLSSPVTTAAVPSANVKQQQQQFDLQPSQGSAFARSNDLSKVDEDKNQSEGEVKAPPGQEGMILTPVMSKVMRGPQQQRATMMTNRMSTLQDDEQNTRLSSARSNLRNFINLLGGGPGGAPAIPPTENNAKDAGSPMRHLQPSLSPITKSVSGDTLHISPGMSPSNNINSPKEMSRSPLNTQQMPSPPQNQQPEPQQQRPVLIPRQKSLSEFPKIANAPRIEPLRVETDVSSLTDTFKQTSRTSNANATATMIANRIQQQNNANVTQIQRNKPSIQLPQQRNVTAQQPVQNKLQHQNNIQSSSFKQIQQQQPTIQQQTNVAKSVTRSYPDSLQRTSSGSSIFNRAKNLFFGNQDGAPPSTKLRPKLPSSPQSTKLTFPKQFEAQMSPDSADRKQRELAAYFRQQQQQQQELLQQQMQLFQGSGKLGVESKAIKSADAVSKSETSSSSISVECEQSDMKASSSLISSSSSVNSSSLSSASSLSSSSVSASTKIQSVSTTSSISMQSMNTTLPTIPINKFKAMDQQANAGKKAGAPIFKFANEGLKATASSAKEILLYWCQCRTREYENVKIDNFSSSWSDGLAFCALIHHFYPDAFDFNSLNPKNRKYNFDLAFRMAEEKAGIYPLLDTEDMVAMGTRPDWKCVFTYVQSMYQKLKDM